MLVLSRMPGESVVIENGRIVVQVIEVRGDKVRLGFTADRGIPIHRTEVAELIAQQRGQDQEAPQ